MLHLIIPGDEIFTIGCGLLSTVGSGSIIMTAILFPSMLRRKMFMHIIVMMSFTDFIASAFISVGYTRDPVLCTIQGATTAFFFISSWLWTTMLSFQLHHLVKYGRPKLTVLGMHLLVWFITIVIFLAPLISNVTYGLPSKYLGDSLCGFTGPDIGVWIDTHYSIALACIALQIYFSLTVYLQVREALRRRLESFIPLTPHTPQFTLPQQRLAQLSTIPHQSTITPLHSPQPKPPSSSATFSTSNSSSKIPAIAAAVSILALYPIGMMVSWLPVIVLCFLISTKVVEYDVLASSDSSSIALAVFRGLGPLYGAFLAIVFYSRSSEARHRWYFLLRKVAFTLWSEFDILCGRAGPTASTETNQPYRSYRTSQLITMLRETYVEDDFTEDDELYGRYSMGGRSLFGASVDGECDSGSGVRLSRLSVGMGGLGGMGGSHNGQMSIHALDPIPAVSRLGSREIEI